MKFIDTKRQLTDIFTKPLDYSRFASLRRGEGGGTLVFAIHMAWFEGDLVICLYICIFCFLLAFSLYSPKSLCFTCYTGLYLLNYAYHYARMSSNEMWTFLLDHD
jgi:hypothetical protein